MPINGRVREIDACLALLVATLNTVPALETVACCCGHGKRPGSILLADGRALVLMTRVEHDAYFENLPPIFPATPEEPRRDE